MTYRREIEAPLDIRVFDSALTLAEFGADMIARVQDTCRKQGRAFVLGLAAGASPRGLYRVLARRRTQGKMRFDDCRTFLLDEYYPLTPRSPSSFHQELSVVLDRLGVPEAHRHFWEGDIPLAEAAAHCAAYEQEIQRAGGVDLQLLGVGRNGHVGFNEPGSPADSRSRMVQLVQTTRKDALPTFGRPDAVPKAALTMGIGTILAAKRVMLLAEGAHKRPMLTKLVHEEPTPDIPVTLLKQHPGLIVLVDTAASPKPPAASSCRENSA